MLSLVDSSTHSRNNKRKIDNLRKRCLRIISIHERNVQILATEMYKVSNDFSPPHMNEVFEVRNEHPYNLRQSSQFFRYFVKLVYRGTENLSYLGPKIWDTPPNIYKNIEDLHKFKKAIKKWKPENCHCRICKKNIANVGFI